MQFTDEEADRLKNWVVKKLEDISDADSDVLADYVLALIRSDAPDDEIRKVSIENLEDFLREHTTAFVDELFANFGPNSAPAPPAQQAPQAIPQPVPTAQFPPTNQFQQQPFDAPTGPRGDYNSRKRSFNEGFQGASEQDGGNYQNRAMKTPRRGRGGGRGDWMGRGGHMQGPGQQFQQGQPAGFPMMPGFPPFDPNDPMAAMMAMQGMGFPQMPGMPPMPGMPGGPGQPGAAEMASQPCPLYENQGICYLGAACPYKHGEPGSSNNNEYDPRSATMMPDAQREGGFTRGNDRGRGRGRGGFGGRGRGRSDFSSAGPNEDRSITTIVVEQIPDEKFSEEAVREFFSQFGNITEVTLQPFKKLALVKFESFAEAKQAWASPKVIFDNRFVKVYWHKPRRDEKNGENKSEEPAFNQEEFEKQQQEAQKSHEERMKKRQEAEEAKQALERQRDELMKKQQEEKARLLQRLGVAPSNGSEAADEDSAMQGEDENVSDETKKLRAQLAALEAEAKTLGLDPANADASGRGGYRGRGGFRGRGAYRGRGGYDPSYRGGYRGRGGFAPRGRGGGVLRLDNRPRRVAVSGVSLQSEKDEALRQHLMGVGDYESIEPNPDQSDSVVVAFKERYQAEKFMFSPWNLTSSGEVQLSWLPNLPAANPPPGPSSESKNGAGDDDQDVMMDSTPTVSAPPPRKENAEMDYDVAEDESW